MSNGVQLIRHALFTMLLQIKQVLLTALLEVFSRVVGEETSTVWSNAPKAHEVWSSLILHDARSICIVDFQQKRWTTPTIVAIVTEDLNLR